MAHGKDDLRQKILELAERAAQAAVAAERERCAGICERIWKEASNERTDSAITSYRQNAIGPGCIACAEAIRKLITD